MTFRVKRVSYASQNGARTPDGAAQTRAFINVVGGFLAAFAMLANPILGPLTPLIVIAFVPFFAVINRNRMVHVLASAGPCLLLPLLALLSVTWSQAPDDTLRYGLLYLLTCFVGSMMGAGMRSQDAISGLFFGLLIIGILNFMLGGYGVTETGAAAFRGIQGSKNAAGEYAGAAVLVSVAMTSQAWINRRYGSVVLGVFGLVIAVSTLVLSKATGALIATSVALPCMICWLISRHMEVQVRTAICGAIMIVVAVMLLTLNLWLPALFELVLDSSGKEVGLTGRTMLWQAADRQIAMRPLLGRGYNAFWVPENLEAIRLWSEMGIESQMGFNFHNTYREILVDLGYIGLIIFVIVATVSTLIVLLRTMFKPSISLIMASALLVYFAMKTPFETFGFGGMHLLTLILFMCWSMGYSSLLYKRNRS